VTAGNFTTPTFGDKNGQTIEVVFDATPPACKVYTTTDAPAAAAPSIALKDNAQGLWWCGGTLVIDTIDGQDVTFHFDTTCKANPVGNPSAGTVKLVGQGSTKVKVNA
jgi:hypothetical protein